MRIFILEDDPIRIKAFKAAFEKEEVDWATEAIYAADMLGRNHYDMAFLDHDLGGEIFVDPERDDTGSGVCRRIASWINMDTQKHLLNTSFIIHSMNPIGARNMENILKDAGCRFVKWIPFSTVVMQFYLKL